MEKEAVRLYILARALSNLGSHYLNGSDGGYPGMKDGYKKRNVKLVERGDYDKVAIHTATYSDKSCTGRCTKAGGKDLGPKDKAVKEYCEKNLDAGLDPKIWQPFEGNLYPRREKGEKNSTIYVGEDCRNVRHFDCISFVNWVLGTALQKSFTYSIVQYEGKKSGSGVIAPVETFEPPFTGLQNADILTKIKWEYKDDGDDDKNENGDWKVDSQHIGFYMAGGKVIEASGAKVGVIISDYKESDWTGMSRIKNSYLKFGA